MSSKSAVLNAYRPWWCRNEDNTAVSTLMKAHTHHTLMSLNVFSLIAKKKRRHELITCRHYPPFHHHRVVHCSRCRRPFTSSTSDKESSNAYGMPAERSLTTSSRVAVVSGVGCDPPSSSSSFLSLSRRDLHRRPSPVSARRGPRTRPSTCSLSPPSSTSPSPPLPAAGRGRRNAASPPASASPSSVGWGDAIRPPRRRRRCRRRAAISTVAHYRYPPDADPGHARRRVRRHRRRRRGPLPPPALRRRRSIRSREGEEG